MPVQHIDLTGGFAPEDDLMSPDVPADDPHYRESVSMWIFDDANQLQLPRFLVEDIAGRRDERLTFYNVAFPGGRSLVEWGQAPASPMLDADGRPTIYGAGGMAFHCLEPFHRWRAEFDGEMFDTRAAELMFAAPSGPRVPVRAEIDTRSVVPLWVLGRMTPLGAEMMGADTDARRYTGHGFRYEQLVHAEGWLQVGDAPRIDFKGRGLRVHRRSSRISTGFPGHVWQTTVFPSGKAFGYQAFAPPADGSTAFREGFYFDGARMRPAEPVEVPWMRLATPDAQDVGVTLRTDAGDIRIEAVTGPTNFSTARSASLGGPDALLQQQGAALYTLDGESAWGMVERSTFRSQLDFRRRAGRLRLDPDQALGGRSGSALNLQIRPEAGVRAVPAPQEVQVQPFVFSCDAHIAEPPDLFLKGMPEGLKQFAIHGEAAGENYRVTKIGDQEILKVRVNFHAHKTSQRDAAPEVDRSCTDDKENFVSDCAVDTKRRGARDLSLRLEDMDRDGVDAELVFPSLGLMLPRIADRDGQREACKVYNDWAWDYTAPVRDRLIPAAMIPCLDFDDALAECHRTAAMGYAAFCLWEGLNNYNDSRWDPIFAFAASKDIPLVFHTGVGDIAIRALKGPGSAMYNYVRQMNDAVDIITQLVAGGVLDRNPDAHILFAEHSAGWLWGLAERMDEVYQGHAPAVNPKLSRMPSQIVRDQVHCALQNDVGSVGTRRGVGVGALLFATDYPHSEGTFPYSREVVKRLMAENPDASMDDFVAVLGGNAAHLFKRANLTEAVERRTRELTLA